MEPFNRITKGKFQPGPESQLSPIPRDLSIQRDFTVIVNIEKTQLETTLSVNRNFDESSPENRNFRLPVIRELRSSGPRNAPAFITFPCQ
jgi:hypothetical protein